MKRALTYLSVLGLAGATTGAAFAGSVPPAGFTEVNTGISGVGSFGGGDVNSFDGRGHTLVDAMKAIYGGTPTGNIYGQISLIGAAGGDVTLTRIQDSLGTGFQNLAGSNQATANDRLWATAANAGVTLTTVAKFAEYNQRFGFTLGADADVTLLANANTPGTTSGQVTLGAGAFQWWRSGNAASFTGNEWYSDPAENQGVDHLVTYSVTRGGQAFEGDQTWLLCWADLPGALGADRDFQDLIVQASVTQAVPTPAAAWMGVLTIGIAGFITQRRRWARQ